MPFLNLVRPYNVMKEIFAASDPNPIRRSRAIVDFWWIAFILAGIVNYIGIGITTSAAQHAAAGRAAMLEGLQTGTLVQLGARLLYFAAAVCMIQIIWRINEMQLRKAEQGATAQLRNTGVYPGISPNNVTAFLPPTNPLPPQASAMRWDAMR